MAELIYKGAELDGVSIDPYQIEKALGISKKDVTKEAVKDQLQSAVTAVSWNDNEVDRPRPNPRAQTMEDETTGGKTCEW